MTASGGIGWLLAALMVCTALWSARNLLLAAGRGAHRGRPDAELLHLVMCSVMAFMLWRGLPASWGSAASLAFAVPVAWFAARIVSPGPRRGGVDRRPRESRAADVGHCLASIAMVAMALPHSAGALPGAVQGAHSDMAVSAAPSAAMAVSMPVVAFLVLAGAAAALYARRRSWSWVEVAMWSTMGLMVAGV